MLFDCLHQVGRSSIVQKPNAFPKTPERRCTEFVAFCLALCDAVIKLCTHVVNRKIGIEFRLFLAQLRDRGFSGLKHRRMAKGASGLAEERLSFRDGAGASREAERGSGGASNRM